MQMYPGIVNSPITELSQAISETDTEIEVLNGEALPEAPNIAVIGQGENAETILYAEKTGNILSEVIRGFQGMAQSWNTGTKVARNFTEYDYRAMTENIEAVDVEVTTLDSDFNNHLSDYVRQPGYAVTAGSGNAYTVTTDPAPTAYVDGMGIVIRANRANTGAATLNWNGLGAVPIVDAKGNDLIAGKIPNGARLSLRYSSAAGNFQLQGEGGEYGNATPAEVMQGYTIGTEEGVLPGTLALTGNAAAGDVIAGQTFYNTNPKSKITGTLALTGDAAAAQVLSGRTFYNTNPKTKLTGTMANRGAVTNTITTQGGQYTIPQGYHSGSGVVTANFLNLIPENVRQGINIGGVVGTFFGGKKFGEGTGIVTTSMMQFTEHNAGPTSSRFLQVEQSFGFTPSIVVLRCLEGEYTTVLLPADFNLPSIYTSLRIIAIREGSSNLETRFYFMANNAYVNSNGFRLPLYMLSGSIEYDADWIAIG